MNPSHAARDIVAGPGLAGFSDPQVYVHCAVVLLAATLSGALIAYHPIQRGRPVTLEELEQRKTVMLYSAVGGLIALICVSSPSMAFVIFGIGGLMRFRTDVGPSKNTGHTIMATLIGLCWGLGLWLTAVLATTFFWLMIYVLEASPARELVVGGVSVADMGQAADAYRDAIARAGGRVLGHSKNFKKKEMTFVIRMPSGVTLERMAKEVEGISEPLRGTPDWPE